MGQKISAPETLKLLPQFMRQDEANIALCSAVDALITDPGSRVKQLRIWDQIDNLPESLLDELAWELNIDWYEDTMEIEAKRATIKTARLIKERRGTVWAVEQVISNIFGDGTVKEWFEYGGSSHHFKVVTSYPLETQDIIEKFRKAVNAAQRESSILDAIEFAFVGNAATYSAAAGTGISLIASGSAINP
jgi:phage tail P2-like protein